MSAKFPRGGEQDLFLARSLIDNGVLDALGNFTFFLAHIFVFETVRC